MNIILGLANFQKNYHRKKNYNLTTDKKIQILRYIEKKDISEIDTSPDYGDSEKIIGKYSSSKIKVHSKLRAIPKTRDKDKLKKWVEKNFFDTFRNLKNKKIKTYFFHGPDDIFKYEGKICYEILIRLKEKGFFEKIGISIYDTANYREILKNFDIKSVQAPGNIFDNRFLNITWQNFFRKHKIEYFNRSLFLQGILADKRLMFKIKDRSSKIMLSNWFSYIEKNKLDCANECLNFAKMKNIKNLVIGMNSKKQISNILNHSYKKNKFLTKFKTNYQNLIDPRLWK